MVREFYDNVVEHDNFRAFVRGKQVPFDRDTINKFYGLLTIEDDKYHSNVKGDFNWE